MTGEERGRKVSSADRAFAAEDGGLELRIATLRSAAVGVAAVSLVLQWVVLSQDPPLLSTAAAATLAVVVALLCLRASAKTRELAAIALLGAVTATVVVSIRSWAGACELAALLALPAVLAGGLFGPAAVLLSGSLAATVGALLLPCGGNRAALAVVILSASGWLVLRSQGEWLKWSWKAAAQALLLAE
jgi:hypothetical protein